MFYCFLVVCTFCSVHGVGCIAVGKVQTQRLMFTTRSWKLGRWHQARGTHIERKHSVFRVQGTHIKDWRQPAFCNLPCSACVETRSSRHEALSAAMQPHAFRPTGSPQGRAAWGVLLLLYDMSSKPWKPHISKAIPKAQKRVGALKPAVLKSITFQVRNLRELPRFNAGKWMRPSLISKLSVGHEKLPTFLLILWVCLTVLQFLSDLAYSKLLRYS